MSEPGPGSSPPASDRSVRGDAGALYVHLQSGTGVEHRTIVLAPRHVRLLRTLWSAWGVALVIAMLASWVYFAIESTRVPFLTRRVADLEAEGVRVDTLRAKLQSLQRQYDQVQRMLGLPVAVRDSEGALKPKGR